MSTSGPPAGAADRPGARGPVSTLVCASCGRKNRIRPSKRGAPHRRLRPAAPLAVRLTPHLLRRYHSSTGPPTLARCRAAMYAYIVRRTQIYLDHEQIAELERVASRSGRTVSHLIREAIERTYGTSGDAERLLEALRTSAGAWRRRRGGAAYVERLRGGRLGRLLRGEENRR